MKAKKERGYYQAYPSLDTFEKGITLKQRVHLR